MYRVTLLNYETKAVLYRDWDGRDVDDLGVMVDRVRDETGSEFWTIHELIDLTPQQALAV